MLLDMKTLLYSEALALDYWERAGNKYKKGIFLYFYISASKQNISGTKYFFKSLLNITFYQSPMVYFILTLK